MARKFCPRFGQAMGLYVFNEPRSFIVFPTCKEYQKRMVRRGRCDTQRQEEPWPTLIGTSGRLRSP